MNLEAWGWSEEWTKELVQLGDPSLRPGRVTTQERTRWSVQTEDGPGDARVVSGHGTGGLPAVGDWVVLRPGPSPDDPWSIEGILTRRSKFSRQAAGERSDEQVVAANVDTVWIVHGLDMLPNPRRMERYLALAWESGAQPEIVLTKADVALLGPSGVGKSSLINRLAGEELLETGDVRVGDKKGRHTTTRRQLVRIDSGALLLDTPGMRELQVWDLDEGLDQA